MKCKYISIENSVTYKLIIYYAVGTDYYILYIIFT